MILGGFFRHPCYFTHLSSFVLTCLPFPKEHSFPHFPYQTTCILLLSFTLLLSTPSSISISLSLFKEPPPFSISLIRQITCILLIPSLIHKVSPTWFCPNASWTRMLPMNMPNWTEERPQGRNPTPREEYTNWLSSVKEPVSNIHTVSIIESQQVIFRNIYVHTYIHEVVICWNKQKEVMNLKESWKEYILGLEGGKGKEKYK